MLARLRSTDRTDIDGLVALTEAANAADNPDSIVTRQMVEAQFDIPGMDMTELSWVLPDEDGRLIASVVAVPMMTDEDETIHIGWTVHPDRRAPALDEHLLRFAEDRARAVRRRRDMPGRLHIGLRPEHLDREALLTRSGYTPTRWFLEMDRPLGDVPEADIPDGFTIRDADGPDMRESVFLTLDESFRDHWHQAHLTREQYDHFLAMMAVAPMRTLLAVHCSGEPAGACVTRISAEKNARRGTREGEVAVLGVRRPYRGKGLGRALLVHSLRWLRDEGMTMATIDVDADSPTGANRLYAGVGFMERRRSVVYMKPMA